MACCAFAIYMLSQLLLPLRWVRDRLFGAPATVASASVAWSPATVAAAPARRRVSPWLLAVAFAELAGLGVAATAASLSPAPAAPSASFFTALHSSICSAVRTGTGG